MDEAAFKKLLLLFDADPKLAGERYELMREKLIRFFEYQRCPPAEDLTDKTFNRVARKISEGSDIKQASLSAYFYSVASRVALEYWRDPEAGARSTDADDFTAQATENPEDLKQQLLERTERERLLDCLETCLEKLPEKDRKLIISYYQGEAHLKIENRKGLAERFKLSISNLRTRGFRIREKLEKCVEECNQEADDE